MLALRLRSSRSIRAQHGGSPCRAHITRAGVNGRSRPCAALVRNYSTPPSSKKKDANATPHADDAPLTGGSPKADTLKIIKESMAFLKKFQENPAPYAEKKRIGGDGEPIPPSVSPAGKQSKYDMKQNRILIDTMSVLKDALQIHVLAETQKNVRLHGADEEVARSAHAMMAHMNAKMMHRPPQERTPLPERPSSKADSNHAKHAEETKNKADSTKQKPQQQLQQPPKKKNTEPERKEETSSKSKLKKKPASSVSDAVSASLASVVVSARKVKAKPKAQNSAAEKKPASNDMPSYMLKYLAMKEKTKNSSMDPFKEKVKKSRHNAAEKKHHLKVTTFRADPASALVPIEADTRSVPLIQYGLDRVLFKDGVYPLQDPRTRVWNFDPYLASIMPVSDFDFDALKEYITSSKDEKLIGITKGQNKKYTGSTSSMTSTLAHFHFLLSNWRKVNFAKLTQGFEKESDEFSPILRAPSATFLNYKDGVYAIDADKEWDDETILSMLGKSMEKFMTVPKEEFERYHRSKSHTLTDEEKGQEEAYHYTTYGDFMMRSQLDAYDPRLPGTGIYDLKTRAVVSIRSDARHHENGRGYEIRQRDGAWESFEKEYYDLIRAAFVKYSLQVRMGRMDGIFVAYHNTDRIFGFQYIPLEEMDLAIHGTMDKTLGDQEFTASLKLFNNLLDRATARFPNQSLRVFVETRTTDTTPAMPFLYFFAQPVTELEIKAVQERNKGNVEAFKKKMGISQEVESAVEEADSVQETADVEEAQTTETVEAEVQEEDSEDIWDNMMNLVEDTMNKDAEGITAIREAIQEALRQSGLLQAKSSEEAERYVEALLKSIVDTEPDTNQQVSAEPVETEPSAPKSGLATLLSWFGAKRQEPEAPAKDPVQEETAVDGAETKDTITEADGGQSPELVELLVKLTSRVGMTASKPKKLTGKAEQQEPLDDQTKIRSFERILGELMPKSVEYSEDAPTAKSTDSTASQSPKTQQHSSNDEIFGAVLTIRNKVNLADVERPQDLNRSDKWDIEYGVEEMKAERAEKLYALCQSRRKIVAYKDPAKKPGNFISQHKKSIQKYTQVGRSFRDLEDKVAKKQPVWIVGQHEPLPAEEVFSGLGAKVDTVLPSLEVPRPNVDEYPGEIHYESNFPPKDFPIKDDSKHGASAATSNKTKNGPFKVSKDDASATQGGKSRLPEGTPPFVLQRATHPLGLPRANPSEKPKSSKDDAGATPKGSAIGRAPLAPASPRSERSAPPVHMFSAARNTVEEAKDKASDISSAEEKSLNSWLQQVEKDSAEDGQISQSVAELRKSEEDKASSFKEWREKSKK